MARYSSFLGCRVEVQYRASDTLLPASGVFVADSGRSIFLEQTCEQRGQHLHFRWEIPYQYLIRIARTDTGETAPTHASGEPAAAEEAPPNVDSTENRASSAAAGAGLAASILPFHHRVHTT